MVKVAFKKGLLGNLPSAYTEGTFYVTTDEPGLYLDIDSQTRVRFGDFQEFDTLAELQGNDNPSTTALYYIKELNCLAKWNGSSYVQINVDTGMTAVEVVGEGNAVTAASYDAGARKLTLTLGAAYTTASDVSGAISTAIGALGDDEEGSPYSTVKDYVDDKIADVVAGSIEGLGALAAKDTVAETDLDTALAEKLNGKADVGSNDDEATADTIKGAKKYAEAEADTAETNAKGYADSLIGALDVADSAVATQLVSAVSETDGKITVSRRALVAEDIPEIEQSKVTGLTSALAGKQDALVFNTAYDAEDNKVATMTDVTNAVAGLSGAMHYIGESTTDPADTVTVEGVEEFTKGDVVTYSAKEYVYDGTAWRELGDEASFAVKGSIKDADIAADAAIAQSKIAGLETALAGKATAADITAAIDALDVPDEAVAGQVVSAVVETDGKIAVSRRALVADDIPTLAISKVEGLQTALDGKAAPADISNAIGALDVEDAAVEAQLVSAVSETDGKITVSRRALVAGDIPELAQSKITGLETALSGKQDVIAFYTAYNATDNKAATMNDVDDAETNAKTYADGLMTWGTF